MKATEAHRLINPFLLAKKLPKLTASLNAALQDSEGALPASEIRYLLLLKLSGFCDRYLDDCQCIEDLENTAHEND